MSSRLFQKLREEMGVCYYVYASLNTSPAYGDMTIQAGVPQGRVHEVVTALSGELRRLREELVDEKELKVVKNYLVGSLMLGLESSDDLAFYFGLQEVLNQPVEMPRDRAKALRAVTPADLRRVARKYLVPEAYRLALIGPKQDTTLLKRALRS
jgi:predicted Zn-dependent peptidase